MHSFSEKVEAGLGSLHYWHRGLAQGGFSSGMYGFVMNIPARGFCIVLDGFLELVLKLLWMTCPADVAGREPPPTSASCGPHVPLKLHGGYRGGGTFFQT